LNIENLITQNVTVQQVYHPDGQNNNPLPARLFCVALWTWAMLCGRPWCLGNC